MNVLILDLDPWIEIYRDRISSGYKNGVSYPLYSKSKTLDSHVISNTHLLLSVGLSTVMNSNLTHTLKKSQENKSFILLGA